MRRSTASPPVILLVSGLFGLLVGLLSVPAVGLVGAVLVLLIAGSGPPRRAIPVPVRARITNPRRP